MALMTETRRAPVHRLAMIGFVLAVLALVLAWYGSLHAEKHIAGSPLREARQSANVIGEPGSWYERLAHSSEVSIFGGHFDQKVFEATERSPAIRYALQFIAYVLPFVLGLAAALMGGTAMSAIDQSAATRSGHFQAVFAIMIGGFAAVIAGCMLASVYLWPNLPSIYTS
jgi:hypothetical protein